MPLGSGDAAPDFEQDTANGSIHFYKWLGSAWCVVLTVPHGLADGDSADLAVLAQLRPAWARRGIKVVGVSADTAGTALLVLAGIEAAAGYSLDLPFVADRDGTVAALFGVDQPGIAPPYGKRHAFVIDAGKRVRRVFVYAPGDPCDPAAILQAIEAARHDDTQTGATPAPDPFLAAPPGDHL